MWRESLETMRENENPENQKEETWDEQTMRNTIMMESEQ